MQPTWKPDLLDIFYAPSLNWAVVFAYIMQPGYIPHRRSSPKRKPFEAFITNIQYSFQLSEILHSYPQCRVLINDDAPSQTVSDKPLDHDVQQIWPHHSYPHLGVLYASIYKTETFTKVLRNRLRWNTVVQQQFGMHFDIGKELYLA